MRVIACFASFAFGAGLAFAQSFAPAVRIHAGGAPIDVDMGHAAPYVVDWDGDGKRDLLVGQFDEGKLRIYRNTGAAAKSGLDEPASRELEFGEYQWFLAGGEPATIAAG